MILNEAIYSKIMEQVPQLIERGDILSDEKLSEYYQVFRRKFGPEILSSLDGEALLSTMHDSGNHDSLVYWLEFKNDDELPNRFGGIGGGSALKFGIYRRGETGIWTTGSPQKQVQLSIGQAIQIARQHRDQLLAGVRLLDPLPENASNEDYSRLQSKMDEVAPDIGNTSWGHKYFHMIFPNKLGVLHNTNFQRFHLLKLLQLPFSAEGRYSIEGQYMAIAKEVNLHVNNLAKVLYEINGSQYRYWSIKANLSGSGSSTWQHWPEMRDGEYIGIGWEKLGDLSRLTYDMESRATVKTMMLEKYKEKGGFAQEIFNFVTVIKKGDIILATEKQGHVLGIGRVINGYYFDSSSRVSHRLKVQWLSLDEWDTPTNEIKHRVVREISSLNNILETEKKVFSGSTTRGPVVILQKTATPLTGIPARVNDILERKRQVIIYGPPGTGKTHWAYQSVLSLSAMSTFGTDYSELNDQQKKSIIGDGQNPGYVRFCTFHPSYGYEDFIEGYRPHSENGALGFALRSGIFKQLCNDAQQQPAKKFYLIIDEINRGDIPRIFGELLTLLEKDKRGRMVNLPVSGESFNVPDNIYLVGTMNTADRSIALLDTALRRRFGFIEIMPDPKTLGDAVINGIPLSPWLEMLNHRILQSVGRDARNLQIGHAYLLENGRPITNIAQLSRVFRDDIIPLLEEYCYEDYEVLEKILGKGLVDREKQCIRHELFGESRVDDLVQALLEPSPEITASLAAVQHEQAEITSEEESEVSLDGTTPS